MSEQPPDAILSPTWTFAALWTLSAAHHKRTITVLLLRGDPGAASKLEATVRKTHSHTWLRAVDADIGQQNIGLAFAWRKAAIRDD